MTLILVDHAVFHDRPPVIHVVTNTSGIAPNDRVFGATQMSLNLFRGAGRAGRQGRRSTILACESLEAREVLNGSTVSLSFGAAALKPNTSHQQVHIKQAPLGTISGTITNARTGKGVGNVAVQLINSQGDIAAVSTTGPRGHYSFKIATDGAYVVREVTPRRFTQTTPTFNFTAPTGAMATNPATGQPYGASSWSYATGNSDPANGAVGPYAWDTVAPAGDLPFESPINITSPPTDLSPYLSINYNSTVPTQIVNNSHQIQVQFPAGNPSDTITVGGQVFNLAQFHYHDPSEHTVYGHGYSMEEHFVNTSASGAESVVGVFLQLGAHNGALDPILNAAMESLTKPNTKTPGTTAIDFAGLLPSSMQGWFYSGSLTTPPLSQTVNWFVLSTPITLDSAQLKEYEAVAGASGFLTNNRPVQPLDGRQVNEFNFDVNFQNQSVAGLNFSITKTA